MWVWVNSGSWWWTGRPGMLRFMGLQRVGHDWATELTELNWAPSDLYKFPLLPISSALTNSWHKTLHKCGPTLGAHLESLRTNSFQQTTLGLQDTLKLETGPRWATSISLPGGCYLDQCVPLCLDHTVKALRNRDSSTFSVLLCTTLEEEMATHFSTLAWRIPWTEEPGGLTVHGVTRVKHDWSDLVCTLHARLCLSSTTWSHLIFVFIFALLWEKQKRQPISDADSLWE